MGTSTISPPRAGWGLPGDRRPGTGKAPVPGADRAPARPGRMVPAPEAGAVPAPMEATGLVEATVTGETTGTAKATVPATVMATVAARGTVGATGTVTETDPAPHRTADTGTRTVTATVLPRPSRCTCARSSRRS
ncbi:hypothetical protein GCM10010320_25390 [Streptomyces caelestis]|nr:hypothetical protein GCM10010320_25390 [Streptomyces caelestis]